MSRAGKQSPTATAMSERGVSAGTSADESSIGDNHVGLDGPSHEYPNAYPNAYPNGIVSDRVRGRPGLTLHRSDLHRRCLLYTSDAADEEDSVDLGGRR